MVRRTLAGISSPVDGRPRFLVALTLIRQPATSAWNRLRFRMDDFGKSSARQLRHAINTFPQYENDERKSLHTIFGDMAFGETGRHHFSFLFRALD